MSEPEALDCSPDGPDAEIMKSQCGDKPAVKKQESLVLYTRAALSPETRRNKGRPPRPGFKTDSATMGSRRPLKKQLSAVSSSSSQGETYAHAHVYSSNPEIVISGALEPRSAEPDPRTPLPVLPLEPPVEDAENDADTEDNYFQFPNFLYVAQRYRRSSLVRMDAVKQPGGSSAQGNEDACRSISVHGSLDLPKKDLSEFREVVSFSAAELKDEDDTITISELRASGGENMLKIPSGFRKRKQKTGRKKRPSLRRLLTASESKLNREELEERHACRKREREERRKERKERKVKEKQRQEELMDKDGVSRSAELSVAKRLRW